MSYKVPAAIALCLLVALAGCAGGSAMSQQSRGITPLTAAQQIGDRTTVVLPKSLDLAQHKFPVFHGTAVYAIPTYRIVYRNTVGGTTTYAYGRITVSRTANNIIVTSTGGTKTQVFPAYATITQIHPSLLFLQPGKQKPPVADGLAPVAIAQ